MSGLSELTRRMGEALRHRFERKASAVGSIIAFHGLGRPIWTPRDYRSLAEESYGKNAIAFRCVRMIAESAASVPWKLFDGDRHLTEHPLLSLLERPNTAQGPVEWLESWYGYQQVAGNAYMEAVEVSGKLRELYVLRPDRMKVVPGPQGWPEAYEYSVQGRTVTFDRRPDGAFMPILHMKLFHPINDHYGMSPIEAAAIAIDIHNAGSAWNKALLDNGARPSGALVYKGVEGHGNLSADQFARLKSELEDNYQGARNAGRPLLLEGGLEWKQMAFSPADMDFIEAKHVAAREIALAFGVPPMLLGIPGDNTYANYREANLVFWRQTILPLVGKTARAISHWLEPHFGDRLRLWYDADQVSALNPEREHVWRRLSNVPFLTINEKRVRVGLNPIDGGDVLSAGSPAPTRDRNPQGPIGATQPVADRKVVSLDTSPFQA